MCVIMKLSVKIMMLIANTLKVDNIDKVEVNLSE